MLAFGSGSDQLDKALNPENRLHRAPNVVDQNEVSAKLEDALLRDGSSFVGHVSQRIGDGIESCVCEGKLLLGMSPRPDEARPLVRSCASPSFSSTAQAAQPWCPKHPSLEEAHLLVVPGGVLGVSTASKFVGLDAIALRRRVVVSVALG